MNGFKRKLVDIPELVEKLRDEKARQKDYLAPQGQMTAYVEKVPVVIDGEPAEKLEVKLALAGDGGAHLSILPQAHGQIANKLDIPKRYYDKMLDGTATDKNLLLENLSHWLNRNASKKRLIRAIDGNVRAFLGSRYRPVSHLDLVTQAVQVVTGQEPDQEEKTYAKGARCFNWKLNPMALDVEFVNPLVAVDMNNLDKGYKILDANDFKPDSPGHGWLGDVGGGGGMVFPAVRISNSETGHGGLTVTAGLYEAICDNTAHIGQSLAQVHIGGELREDELWSPETQKKMNAVIFSKVRDVMRQAFNPEQLLAWAKRFKGLELVQVHDVKEAVGNVVELGGLTEEVRDDILLAYYGMTAARGNLFDLQRAVTGAAHKVRETNADNAGLLEDLGGRIIEDGAKVLVAAKK